MGNGRLRLPNIAEGGTFRILKTVIFMTNNQGYIAVFDSGVGGISVLKRLMQQMPQERYLYYGDSANAPYGDRSEAEILELTLAAVAHILTRPVKALVIACNTATAVAVDTLRQTYPELPIFGIEPALKPAADSYPGGTVGILGTTATLESSRFHALLSRHLDRCNFVSIPVPELVPLVERGIGNSRKAFKVLKKYLDPYEGQLDALVLGCTHYPFASASIRACVGLLPLLDGSIGTAAHVKRVLTKKGLLSPGPGELLWENSSPDPKHLEICKLLLTQALES